MLRLGARQSSRWIRVASLRWHSTANASDPSSRFSSLDPSSPSDARRAGALLAHIAQTRRRQGDFVPKDMTADLCAAYPTWCADGKRTFLQELAGMGASDESGAAALKAAADKFMAVRFSGAAAPGSYGGAELALRSALQPGFASVLPTLVAHNNGGPGMQFVVGLREDVLSALRREDCPMLRYLDGSMARLLRAWFSEAFLEMHRVTWQSSGSLLEKIGEGEKVHKMADGRKFRDLKVRLGPGRRCFAFMHPSMPGEPLVFIHVALVPGMAATLSELDRETGSNMKGQEGEAGAAIFWSISATQPGLAGVDLGSFLIKKVVMTLQQEWPVT